MVTPIQRYKTKYSEEQEFNSLSDYLEEETLKEKIDRLKSYKTLYENKHQKTNIPNS